MVTNYSEHKFKIKAEILPESCTCCPFWMPDMKTLERGFCFITESEIRADGAQDEKRMDDCPIKLE